MITDSAFGFGESVVFLFLWGIKCVTSIRAAQKSCFSSILDFKQAFEEQEKLRIAKMKKKALAKLSKAKKKKVPMPLMLLHRSVNSKTKRKELLGSGKRQLRS